MIRFLAALSADAANDTATASGVVLQRLRALAERIADPLAAMSVRHTANDFERAVRDWRVVRGAAELDRLTTTHRTALDRLAQGAN